MMAYCTTCGYVQNFQEIGTCVYCLVCNEQVPTCDGCGNVFYNFDDYDDRHDRSDGIYHPACCPQCHPEAQP